MTVQVRAVIFDLDGTLVDSAPDIHWAVNEVLEMDGLAPLSLETVRGFVGGGVPLLIERVMGACDVPKERFDAYVAVFMKVYEECPAGLGVHYDGVESALDALWPMPLGLCTNKPFGPTRGVLAHFGWTERFGVIVAGDTLPVRKPDPAPLHLAVERIGGGAVFVGDSEVDAETAARAGVPFLLFTGGYRKAPIEALPHLAAFDHWRDFPALLRRVARLD